MGNYYVVVFVQHNEIHTEIIRGYSIQDVALEHSKIKKLEVALPRDYEKIKEYFLNQNCLIDIRKIEWELK